jgi:hypothetical protein
MLSATFACNNSASASAASLRRHSTASIEPTDPNYTNNTNEEEEEEEDEECEVDCDNQSAEEIKEEPLAAEQDVTDKREVLSTSFDEEEKSSPKQPEQFDENLNLKQLQVKFYLQNLVFLIDTPIQYVIL